MKSARALLCALVDAEGVAAAGCAGVVGFAGTAAAATPVVVSRAISRGEIGCTRMSFSKLAERVCSVGVHCTTSGLKPAGRD